MKYTYIRPPLPSFARWRAIYGHRKDLSCIRALEYERLRRLTLDQGQALAYDRLVLAPGIDIHWDALPGYDLAAAERMR